MADAPVLYQKNGYILTITVNRAEQRNTMTPELLAEVGAAFERAAGEDDIRCVVVTGKGTNFCGGADLSEGAKGFQVPGHQHSSDASFAMYQHFLKGLDIKVPVIAAMQGHAVGGGLGLAMVADIRIANEAAKYGSNFTKLGIHPGMATTYLLPRLIGMPRAAELLFTGKLLSGKEAEQMGLVNYAVPADQVLARAQAMAEDIAAAGPVAVRWTKQSLYRHMEWQPYEAAEWEAHLQSRTVEMDDAEEGAKALIEKRVPSFTGR